MPVRMRRALAFFTLLTLVACASAIGQEAAGDVPVSMVVTVRPLPGKRPAVLHQDDVRVYQGKQRLKVTGWTAAKGDHAGLELFILIDDSASTSLGSQLGDIRDFINGMPSTTSVGVGYMANATVRIAQNFTKDHAAAAKALRLPLGALSAMDSPYLSLMDLMKRWPNSHNRREVVMITDGIDRFRMMRGFRTLPSISTDAISAGDMGQRDRIIVHSIYTQGIGHLSRNFWIANMGENNASMVADVTGGESYFLGYLNPPSFKPWLDQLSDVLKNQYWLTFEVKPSKKAGLVFIRLETEVPGADLVHANNVYVPAAK